MVEPSVADITQETRAPKLLPFTIAVSLLLWVITTTGGRDLFVKEVLGDAYDSQAEHLLHGDTGVDVDAIRSEAMIVDGKVQMYFGPFPALLRIPLNFIYPAGRGMWSRFSGYCAGVTALFAFAGLVSTSLSSSSLSFRARNWMGNACVAGFALGSPLLFLLGNLSIYSESIIWGLACSLAALYFVCLARTLQGSKLTACLLAFSFCAAGALLSRVTFGLPLLLIGVLVALDLPRQARLSSLTALLLPLGTGLAFHLALSYAKFHTFLGVSYEHYINPVHKAFAHKYGMLNVWRAPFNFADYFGLRLPSLDSHAPFVIAGRRFFGDSPYSSLPFSETYLSVTWASGWLVLGALAGVVFLCLPNRADWFNRGAALALLLQVFCILAYFALAQRYTADLYPFLIFCFTLFLRTGGVALLRTRYAIVSLIVLSIALNSLATASWLAADGNLPIETRSFWNAVVGKAPPR